MRIDPGSGGGRLPGELPYSDDTAIGGAGFAALVEALRRVQDGLRMADVPTAEAGRAADLIDQAAAIVSAFPVVEGRQAVSRRADLPGRGNALAAPFVVVQSGGPDDPWVAQGMFTSAYIGRVAVHGGWVAHLFDEFLGRLAEFPSEPARTAYLTVNFRALTPVGVPLRLEYKVSAREGRKIFATGRLLDGDGLTAEAEGLWVKLRRG